jgi:hypothetical protein
MIRRAPVAEIFIFFAGVIGAIAAGVYGFQVVGWYGDGAFASGFHRELDPRTGQSVLVHEVQTSKGRIRRVIDDTSRVREILIDADADGKMEVAAKVGTGTAVGAGFSLAGDGVIDAWAYRDAANRLVRIEVSTKRDGRIDRWEHYKNELLSKVELDTNGNGRPDRWQIFDNGILMETVLDVNEDGQPDNGSKQSPPGPLTPFGPLPKAKLRNNAQKHKTRLQPGGPRKAPRSGNVDAIICG